MFKPISVLPTTSRRRPFVQIHNLILAFFVALTAGCNNKQAQPTSTSLQPRKDAWQLDWQYQNAAWYGPLTKLMTNPHKLSNQSLTAQWQHLIDSYCEQASQNPWFTQTKQWIKTQEASDHNPIALIDFSGSHINDDCAAMIAFLAAKQSPQGFHLDLSNNAITNKGLAYLKQITNTNHSSTSSNIDINLQENPGIGALGIHHAKEHADGVQWHLDKSSLTQQQIALAQALLADAKTTLPRNEMPHIKSHQVFAPGSRGIKMLINTIGTHDHIKSITLTAPKNAGQLDTAAVSAFKQVLPHYLMITSFTLSNHPIKDQGAISILQALQPIRQLRLLNLSGTGISNNTLIALPNYLPSTMMVIMVDNNPAITDDAIRQLESLRPKWVIMH